MGVAGAAPREPDDVVGGVGDVKVAVGIHGEFLRTHVDGIAEAGGEGRVAGCAGARDGVDVAVDGRGHADCVEQVVETAARGAGDADDADLG